MTVLESLWLVGNRPWLEEHIGAVTACAAATIIACSRALPLPRRADFASVQAAMMGDATKSWWQGMTAQMQYFAAVA